MTKNISIADLQVLLAAGGVNLVDVLRWTSSPSWASRAAATASLL